MFKCGSVVFVTSSGLEVGYVVSGGGEYVYAGKAIPRLVRGAWNSFIDIRFPEEVRELIMKKIIAWREVFQQQRIAEAVERIASKTTSTLSISEELARLKELLDKGVITKEEYEKAKKKLLGE
uniref:SHOCT domain-containing protein n=1 Tax=Staphylothermus marinus TaxID=2280 RepID=A0A7J3PL26_STAMA